MTSQPITQHDRPRKLGELRAAGYASRSVKDEMRSNLITKIRSGERLFPGIVGYDESVVPQIVNAILAKHNFILLGLRGQAKSRIIRQLTQLFDEEIPLLDRRHESERGACLDPEIRLQVCGRAVW